MTNPYYKFIPQNQDISELYLNVLYFTAFVRVTDKETGHSWTEIVIDDDVQPTDVLVKNTPDEIFEMITDVFREDSYGDVNVPFHKFDCVTGNLSDLYLNISLISRWVWDECYKCTSVFFDDEYDFQIKNTPEEVFEIIDRFINVEKFGI